MVRHVYVKNWFLNFKIIISFSAWYLIRLAFHKHGNDFQYGYGKDFQIEI